MDPNANLEHVRRIIETMLDPDSESIDTGEALELAELVQALDGWIVSGGFLPEPWSQK